VELTQPSSWASSTQQLICLIMAGLGVINMMLLQDGFRSYVCKGVDFPITISVVLIMLVAVVIGNEI